MSGPQSRPSSPLASPQQAIHAATRRQFFADCGVGVGKAALASMLAGGVARASSSSAASAPPAHNPLAPRPPHHAPKAKAVIYLFMVGAPSQLDLFDYKPELVKWDGKPIPPEVIRGQRYAFIQPDANVLAPRFKFARHGQSGAELSEVLPHMSKMVDDIALVKSVHTDQFNHAPAQIMFNTGSAIPGRPSMGSWLGYGLGSESDDLPGFVVLKSGGNISGGAAMWSAGFLPAEYQGVPFRSQGDPILNVSNPPGFDRRLQRDSLDLIGRLNRQRREALNDPRIAARISAYELAFRMQTSAPDLMNIADEDPRTLEMYGAKPGGSSYANNCLLARRLVERGVRFVQVYHGNWDHHSNVEGGVRSEAKNTDQASAALLTDLKQRGLLDDTLVIWGGEFGRTPMVESNAALGRKLGRDHHPQAFTMWLAGAGVRKGVTHGRTDELGFHVVEDPVHVHDMQATFLHLMGIDHERLTFKHQGLDFRLTGVEPHEPVWDLLA